MSGASPVEERERLAGFDTRVIRVDGASDRPTLLLLHGFSDSADGWRRLQSRLADSGLATVAVDQPSQGRADRLDPDRPAVEQFIEFNAAAARRADRGAGVIVVGNSLGGANSLLLAQHHPDLVRGVVAIAPASFDHPRWFGVIDDESRVGQALRRRRERFDAGADVTVPPRARPVVRGVSDVVVRTVAFGRPWRAPAGFVRDMRRQFREPDRRVALRDLALCVRDEYLHTDPIELDRIERPVLAIWGSLDRLVSLSSRHAFETGLADVESVVLRGVGHMPQLEVPGRTAKLLVAFTERVVAGETTV